MITVKIGPEERSYNSADESWINQQLNMRRDEGQSVCVRVTIQENGADIMFSTRNCPSSGGVPKQNWRLREQQASDLWKKCHMNDVNFTGGNFVAFLKQLSHLF